MTDRSRPNRPLSAVEKALWDAVAKTTQPLRKNMRITETTDTQPVTVSRGRHQSIQKNQPKTAGPKPATEPRIKFTAAEPLVSSLHERTPSLDRRTARRLRRGDRQPEARIDLHGMSADRAEQALRRFILGAYQRGDRCVLVITGKGGRQDRSADDPFRDYGIGKGVLKTLTPEWLRSPALAAYVTDVFQAHQSHGGGGALYVYLRKNPTAKDR